MPLKNLFLVILITILLTSTFYANLDNLMPFFQKITGYTTIVLYGTVESPQTNATSTQETTTLTATIVQPKKEEPAQVSASETTATVEPKNETKQYTDQTILLNVINQTENLIVKLDKLRTSSRDILDYYSFVNDTENVDKWINIIVHFNQALDDLEDIRLYSEGVKNSATKEDVNTIKAMIGEVLKTTNKIIKLIKSE